MEIGRNCVNDNKIVEARNMQLIINVLFLAPKYMSTLAVMLLYTAHHNTFRR